MNISPWYRPVLVLLLIVGLAAAWPGPVVGAPGGDAVPGLSDQVQYPPAVDPAGFPCPPGSLAQASPKPGAEGSAARPGSRGGFSGQLNLSTAQRTKMTEIHQRFERRRRDLEWAMRAKRLELATMMRTSAPDRKKLEAKVQELVELERRRQFLMLDEFFEVKKILSPQQFELFRERIANVVAGEGGHGGGRPGGRAGSAPGGGQPPAGGGSSGTP